MATVFLLITFMFALLCLVGLISSFAHRFTKTADVSSPTPLRCKSYAREGVVEKMNGFYSERTKNY